MAKKTEDVSKLSFEERAAEIGKKFGVNKKRDDRMVIPTGSIALNKAFGGGYVTGRIFEFIAWEGSGKTTLCLHAIKECQELGGETAYIDAEHTLDRKYAEAIGVDWEKFRKTLFQPNCGEEGFDYVKELIATGDVRLVVVDSTSGMLPKKLMESDSGSSNLGLHARLMGAEIAKLQALADTYNTCIIFVSQFREKIGVMFGSPETTQGGNALKFWASVRTELRKTLDKDGLDVNGIIARFKTIKNKIAPPYQTGSIPVVFGTGIDKLQELIDLGAETEILKVYGKSITVLSEGVKYDEKEFKELLITNPEFFSALELNIYNKLNGIFIPVTENVN